jgi:hypothetical protein
VVKEKAASDVKKFEAAKEAEKAKETPAAKEDGTPWAAIIGVGVAAVAAGAYYYTKHVKK